MGLLRSSSYVIAALCSSIVLVNAEQIEKRSHPLLSNIICQGGELVVEGCSILKDVHIEDDSIYVTFCYGPEGGDEARRSTDLKRPHV
jgi:hypothetical protein